MFDGDAREVVTQSASQRDQAMPLAAELAWCRLVGFSEREWQRLCFMRWLYRQGRLTEFPHEYQAVPGGVLAIWHDEWRWKSIP